MCICEYKTHAKCRLWASHISMARELVKSKCPAWELPNQNHWEWAQQPVSHLTMSHATFKIDTKIRHIVQMGKLRPGEAVKLISGSMAQLAQSPRSRASLDSLSYWEVCFVFFSLNSQHGASYLLFWLLHSVLALVLQSYWLWGGGILAPPLTYLLVNTYLTSLKAILNAH